MEFVATHWSDDYYFEIKEEFLEEELLDEEELWDGRMEWLRRMKVWKRFEEGRMHRDK